MVEVYSSSGCLLYLQRASHWDGNRLPPVMCWVAARLYEAVTLSDACEKTHVCCSVLFMFFVLFLNALIFMLCLLTQVFD